MEKPPENNNADLINSLDNLEDTFERDNRQFIEEVYYGDPKVKLARNYFANLLKLHDKFDEVGYNSVKKNWDNEHGSGFVGTAVEIEKMKGKHGKMYVYHYPDTGAINFEYRMYGSEETVPTEN